LTEVFLHHSTVLPHSTRFVDLSEVPPPVFSKRLGLIVNTWYYNMLANDNTVFFGDNPSNLSTYGFDFGLLPPDGSVAQSVVDESCAQMCTRSTLAAVTTSVEVFAYNRLWLALLFATSAVLLATGLAGSILSWRVRTPNVLGYAASMTYNNDYVDVPSGGGVLDAMERARMLGDLHVSIGDVAGGEKTGRIAFTSRASPRKLEDGRSYT
jgi:hypothetical protein